MRLEFLPAPAAPTRAQVWTATWGAPGDIAGPVGDCRMKWWRGQSSLARLNIGVGMGAAGIVVPLVAVWVLGR